MASRRRWSQATQGPGDEGPALRRSRPLRARRSVPPDERRALVRKLNAISPQRRDAHCLHAQRRILEPARRCRVLRDARDDAEALVPRREVRRSPREVSPVRERPSASVQPARWRGAPGVDDGEIDAVVASGDAHRRDASLTQTRSIRQLTDTRWSHPAPARSTALSNPDAASKRSSKQPTRRAR